MTIPVTTRLAAADLIKMQTPPDRRLEISYSDDFSPPSDAHNLLLGFHFGSKLSRETHPAIINLQLRPLNRDQLFEGWWYKGEVTHTSTGLVNIAECDDYTVALVQREAVKADAAREQAREAYFHLLEAVAATRHTNLVKVWNYFGDINSGDDDQEKYRQFSIGRAEAFSDANLREENMPTGTAIGTANGSGLSLIALASNNSFLPAENPRQVSAFHYPRQYGPRSPKFSRGGLVTSKDHKLVLISGTAAVVGHESNYPYDTKLQLNETFKNLEFLCASISNLDQEISQFELDDKSVLRVYLKDPGDFDLVAEKIYKKFNGTNRNVAFLHGTICRKELTVEIDGVKVS